MNETETGRLLTAVKTLDPRFPEPDAQGFVLRLWTSTLADVPSAAAEKAMTAYYRSERYLEKREPISPADIVQWWNARRRPNERERQGSSAATARELPRAPFDPAVNRRGMDRVIAALSASKGLDSEAAECEAAARRMVRQVACPHCKAAVGAPCVQPHSGAPLMKASAHPAREEAAFKSAGSSS